MNKLFVYTGFLALAYSATVAAQTETAEIDCSATAATDLPACLSQVMLSDDYGSLKVKSDKASQPVYDMYLTAYVHKDWDAKRRLLLENAKNEACGDSHNGCFVLQAVTHLRLSEGRVCDLLPAGDDLTENHDLLNPLKDLLLSFDASYSHAVRMDRAGETDRRDRARQFAGGLYEFSTELTNAILKARELAKDKPVEYMGASSFDCLLRSGHFVAQGAAGFEKKYGISSLSLEKDQMEMMRIDPARTAIYAEPLAEYAAFIGNCAGKPLTENGECTSERLDAFKLMARGMICDWRFMPAVGFYSLTEIHGSAGYKACMADDDTTF